MEYMACGKPAIATACTGHADIVTADNALTIATKGEIRTSSDGMATATWPEPSLDDTIDKLEWAYQNRDALKPIADRGAESIRTRTWTQTAKAFLAML
jgi:glycosyltransferase involved in cell wall biosynthesis